MNGNGFSFFQSGLVTGRWPGLLSCCLGLPVLPLSVSVVTGPLAAPKNFVSCLALSHNSSGARYFLGHESMGERYFWIAAGNRRHLLGCLPRQALSAEVGNEKHCSYSAQIARSLLNMLRYAWLFKSWLCVQQAFTDRPRAWLKGCTAAWLPNCSQRMNGGSLCVCFLRCTLRRLVRLRTSWRIRGPSERWERRLKPPHSRGARI